jgi:hypothetical protein
MKIVNLKEKSGNRSVNEVEENDLVTQYQEACNSNVPILMLRQPWVELMLRGAIKFFPSYFSFERGQRVLVQIGKGVEPQERVIELLKQWKEKGLIETNAYQQAVEVAYKNICEGKARTKSVSTKDKGNKERKEETITKIEVFIKEERLNIWQQEVLPMFEGEVKIENEKPGVNKSKIVGFVTIKEQERQVSKEITKWRHFPYLCYIKELLKIEVNTQEQDEQSCCYNAAAVGSVYDKLCDVGSEVRRLKELTAEIENLGGKVNIPIDELGDWKENRLEELEIQLEQQIIGLLTEEMWKYETDFQTVTVKKLTRNKLSQVKEKLKKKLAGYKSNKDKKERKAIAC